MFSVSLINIGLGIIVSGGLHFMGVPKAAMWGMLVAIMNFVPYFGPVSGVILLATVGLLTFDTLWQGLLPPGWYLLLHLLEANFIAPMLLGRRFTLNPAVIFVSLIFWTWLWGVPCSQIWRGRLKEPCLGDSMLSAGSVFGGRWHPSFTVGFYPMVKGQPRP